MLIGACDVLLMISNKNICGAYMQSKSVDWFLYDNGLRHEGVK